MLRKLVGYATYMFGANAFTALLTFGVSVLGMVTRPKEAFGDYAIYLLVYEIGNGVLIYGVNAGIQKYAADDKEHRLRFVKLTYIAFIGLSALFGVVGFFAWQLHGIELALGFWGIPWVVVFWYGRYILRSTLDARGEARLLVIGSLSNSVAQFLFLTLTDFRNALIYGDAVALVIGGGMALLILPKGVGAKLSEVLKVSISREFLREVGRFVLPLWVAGLVYLGKVRLHAVWTGAQLGSRAMGALQGAATMWQFAAKPMEFLAQASLPGLVSAKEDRDILYREILRISIVSLTAIGIAVAVGVPFIFDVVDFISAWWGREGALLGDKYAEVPALMAIMALVVPMTAVEMVTNQYSIAVGRQRVVLYAQIVNLTLIAVTLLPLAKLYGLWGVFIATSIGEVGNALTFVILLWKNHRDSMRTAAKWMVIATSAAFAALAYAHWAQSFQYPWLHAVPATLIFLVLAAAGGLIKKLDFERIKAAIQARRAKT